MQSAGQPKSVAIRSKLRKIQWCLAFAVTVAYAAWWMVQWSCYYINTNTETQWKRAYQDAFVNKTPFGTDFVFSYGPWGFIAFDLYHPSLYAIAVGTRAALTLWFVAWLWILGRRAWNGNLLMVAVVVLAVTTLTRQHHDLLFVTLVFLPAIDYFFASAPLRRQPNQGLRAPPEGRSGSIWVRFRGQGLVLVAAFACLVKFSCFVIAAVLVAAIALHVSLRERRFPWIVPIFAAEVLFFWLLAGQPLSAFLPYLLWSVETAQGYVAMASGTANPYRAGVPVLGALLLLPLAWAQWRRDGKWAWIPLLGFGAASFAIFRHCVVRFDNDHAALAAAFPILALLVLPLSWPAHARWKQPMIALAFASLLVPKVIDLSLGAPAELGMTKRLPAAASYSPVGGQSAGRAELHAAALAAIRRAFPLPITDGTFDAYPDSVAVLDAHGVKLRRRPVFQGYTVYTSRLAKLNADHLTGLAAPDRILFEIGSIDRRFAPQDDALSWPELLARYEVESVLPPGRKHRFLILKRSSQPRRYEFAPILRTETDFGSPLDLPASDDGPIWAEISVRPTVAGRIAAGADTPPVVWMEVVSRDGQKSMFRLVTAVAESGFLLSPCVMDTVWFRWLAATRWRDPAWQRLLTGKGVRSVRFLSDKEWCYEKQVSVSLSRLHFPQFGTEPMAFRPSLLGLFELAANGRPDSVDRDSPTRWENLPGGAALATPNGASLLMPLSQDNRYLPFSGTTCRLRVSYGLLCTGAAECRPKHPLHFRIDRIDANGWRETVWAASLDIARRPADEGIHSGEFTISLANARSLCFETERPEEADGYVPAWSGVTCQ